MNSTTHVDGQNFTAAHYNNLRADVIIAGANVYNVKDYGALGDRTNDDTAAIQAAITASYLAGTGSSGAAIVYFPPGTYKITDTLTATNPTNIMGAGNGSVIVQMTAGKDVLQMGSVGNKFAAGCSVQDIAMYGIAGTRDVLVILNAHWSFFKNVKIPGAARYGIRLQALECTFIHCDVDTNLNAMIDGNLGAPPNPVRGLYCTSSDTPVSGANANTFLGCSYAGCNAVGSFGALIDIGTTNAFIRCQFEGNDTGLSFSTTSAVDNTVLGCGFESNTAANFVDLGGVGYQSNKFIATHGLVTNQSSPPQCTDRYTLASAAVGRVWNGSASFVGMVTIVNLSTGSTAMFETVGAGPTVALIYGAALNWSVTKGTASKVNVYWDAGNARIEIQNNMAVTRSFEVYVIASAL